MSEASDFLETLRPLDKPIQWQEAYGAIFRKVNDLQRGAQWDKLDDLLREFDTKQLSPSMAIAFIGYTHITKDVLKERDGLWERAYAEAVRLDGVESADRDFLILR